MPRIALLPEHVASQVAAGEVVERPASVVKELVENSIDARATRIEVAIRKGGRAEIRVVDDGIGMDRDDALLCLERHATSKIRTGDDLAAITTLGFRGEALPSIASVSRFRLATRERGALAGTEVIVHAGRIESVRDCGEAEGTQIEARSLFYNLPARRKFLRTEQTESSHVEAQLQLQAIGHPGMGFVFMNDERLVFHLPPGQTLRDRLRDLVGGALVKELLEVPEAAFGGLHVHGFIGRAGVSRATRQQQVIFLNGRAVENSTLNHALREGYHTALMKGQHPVTYLFLEMDPAVVDVNVHPAKREVRFRDPAMVREALVAAIRRALESDRAAWSATFQPAPASPPVQAPEPAPSRPAPLTAIEAPQLIPPREQHPLRKDWSEFAAPRPQPSAPAPTPAVSAARPPQSPGSDPSSFKILGVLGRLYVLMENPSGLVVVDQHAAHERILFEEMRRRMEEQGVPTQRLLLALTLDVSPRDADWIREHRALLDRAGISLEAFGANTFKIDALPTFLRSDDPVRLVREIIDELRDTSSQASKLRLGEDMIAKTVCRHAVKANDVLREPELVRLIGDLLACDLPYCCPHGRPTMIQISYLELEKKFGRKV
jgi:DNA mismatch repair protein MutL